MRLGRKRASLARLEIHDIVADSATPERQRRIASLAEQRQIDAEMAICRFRSGDRLKYQIDRRTALYGRERRRYMRQYTALTRQIEPRPQSIEKARQLEIFFEAIGRRVDADDGVARAQHQPVEYRGGDPAHVVGRMVRLQPSRQPALEP